MIEQHKSHNKTQVKSGAPEEKPVLALLVTPVELLLLRSDDINLTTRKVLLELAVNKNVDVKLYMIYYIYTE